MVLSWLTPTTVGKMASKCFFCILANKDLTSIYFSSQTISSLQCLVRFPNSSHPLKNLLLQCTVATLNVTWHEPRPAWLHYSLHPMVMTLKCMQSSKHPNSHNCIYVFCCTLCAYIPTLRTIHSSNCAKSPVEIDSRQKHCIWQLKCAHRLVSINTVIHPITTNTCLVPKYFKNSNPLRHFSYWQRIRHFSDLQQNSSSKIISTHSSTTFFLFFHICILSISVYLYLHVNCWQSIHLKILDFCYLDWHADTCCRQDSFQYLEKATSDLLFFLLKLPTEGCLSERWRQCAAGFIRCQHSRFLR